LHLQAGLSVTVIHVTQLFAQPWDGLFIELFLRLCCLVAEKIGVTLKPKEQLLLPNN
jgi:hypothetical protein